MKFIVHFEEIQVQWLTKLKDNLCLLRRHQDSENLLKLKF